MKKIVLALLVISVFVLNIPAVSARSYSSRSYSSRSYSSSRSTTRSTPRSTTHTSSSTPRSTRVGTSQLRSRTSPPRPHTYNGRSYNSSTAPYTNSRGAWVYWWIFVPNTTTGKKEIQCFDKSHKRVTCNRDSKSYQKDW